MILSRGIVSAGVALRGLVDRGVAGAGGFAPPSGYLQWNNGQNDGASFLDRSGNDYELTPINGAALVLDLSNEIIFADDVPSGATVSNEGTAVLAVDAANDKLTVSSAGTCWRIEIDDSGTAWGKLPCAEKSGSILYETINGRNASIDVSGPSTIRTQTEDSDMPNLFRGCSRAINFIGDGTDTVASYAATNIVLGSSYEFTIKANCAADHTVIGKSYFISRYPRLEFLVTGGGIRYLRAYDETSVLVSSPYDWETDTDYEFGFIVNSGAWSLSVNGVEFASGVGYIPPTSGLLIGAQLFAWKGYVWEVELNGISLWKAANAYDTTWPDSVGSNNATLVNTEFLHLPALDDGSDDVAGLGLTNPPAVPNVLHNNCEIDLRNADESALYHSALWFTIGVQNEVSFGDLTNWISGTNNTFVNCYTLSNGTRVHGLNLIYAEDREFIPTEYIRILNRYPNTCGSGGLQTPYLVESGGLGPSGTWYTADGTHIYLVDP